MFDLFSFEKGQKDFPIRSVNLKPKSLGAPLKKTSADMEHRYGNT